MLSKVPHFIQGTGDRLATFMFYVSGDIIKDLSIDYQ